MINTMAIINFPASNLLFMFITDFELMFLTETFSSSPADLFPSKIIQSLSLLPSLSSPAVMGKIGNH